MTKTKALEQIYHYHILDNAVFTVNENSKYHNSVIGLILSLKGLYSGLAQIFQDFQLNKIKPFLLIAVFLLNCFFVSEAHAQTPRILYINSYHPGNTWSDMIFSGIQETLTKQYGKKYDLRVEHLDAKRYGAELTGKLGEQILLTWMEKYKGIPIDVILVSDQDGYNFINRARNKLFPGVPVVFSGVESPGKIPPNTTGVLPSIDFAENLSLMLKVIPNLKEVWVVTDPSTTGTINRQRFATAAKAFAGKLRIKYFDENNQGVMPDQLINNASKLRNGAAIFFMDYYRTPKNDAVNIPSFLKMLSSVDVPTFSHVDIYIDYGVTGGYMTSGKLQGKHIADLGIRIISGIPIATLKPENVYAVPIFDEKKLNRFGISAKNLPKNAYIRSQDELHIVKSNLALGNILGDTIHARGDHHYPPYEFINSDGKPDGFNVEIIKAVAAAMGMEIKIDLGEWGKVRQQLESGDIDLLIGMFNTPERDKKVDFSIPMFVASSAVYVRDDSDINGINDLKNKTVILQKGDLAYDYFIENRITKNIILKNEWTDVLVALSKGEGDAAVVSRIQGNNYIKEKKLNNLKAVGAPIIQRKYCMAVTEGNSLLLAKINEGLSLIKTSGEYERIYQKWFGVIDPEANVTLITIKIILWIGLPLLVLLIIILIFSWILRRQVKLKTRELFESEQKARAVFDQSFQLIGVLTTDGTLIEVNHTALRFVNSSLSHLIGKPFWDTPWWNHSVEVQDRLKDAIRRAAQGEIIHYETNHLDANGNFHYIDFSIKPITDKQGKVIYLIPEGRDITHIKQSEEALQQSEKRFRLLFEAMPFPIVVTRISDQKLIIVNEAYSKLLGYSRNEIIGKTSIELGADPEINNQQRKEIMETGMLEGVIISITKTDGTMQWFQYSAILTELDGEQIAISGWVDITELKIAEEALIQANKVVENSPAILFKWKAAENWPVILVSKNISQFGFNQEDFLSKKVLYSDIVHPEDLLRMNEEIEYYTSNKIDRYHQEYRILTKNSEVRWVDDRTTVIRSVDGTVEEYQGIIIDITERKLAEQALIDTNLQLEQQYEEYMQLNEVLRVTNLDLEIAKNKAEENELKFREMANLLPQIIFEMDLNGTLTFINNQAYKITGYPEDYPLIGSNAIDYYVPEDRARALNNIKRKLAGQSEGLNEYTMIRYDGNQFPVLIFSSPIIKDNQPIGLRGVILDITDRKKAEEEKLKLTEQLHQSQKMDAIGQLAGGIAHDFNNLLAGIIGFAEVLKLTEKLNENQNKYVAKIIESAEKAGNLTKKLLSFSRQGSKASTSIDITKVLNDTIEILHSTIDKNIEISFKNNAQVSLILGDDTLLQNAFLNMSINAAHAMPNGGKLTFSIENIKLDKNYCELSSFNIKPGDYIVISIKDTGIGMPPEISSRIFEPFFTTKEQGKGTGLGLSMVYAAVQEHSGAITVSSEPGQGTVFHIYLPLSNDTIIIEQSKETLSVGTGTILIVEDEEIIRISSKSQLESLGYTVYEAENGKQAIEFFQSNYEKIDLIILDMVMPIMGGREAFVKLRAIKPDIPIIIASGFAKEEDMNLIKEQNLSGFLQKPYRLAELSEKVSNAIAKK